MASELECSLPIFKVPHFNNFFIKILFVNVSGSELILIRGICLDVFRGRICRDWVSRRTDLLDIQWMLMVVNHSRNVILYDFCVAHVKLRGKFSEEWALIKLLGRGPLLEFSLQAPFDDLP